MTSAQLNKFASVKPASIEWRNGHPYSLEFDDVYFSDSGAIEESQYVFIEGCQLEQDWDRLTKTINRKQFCIAELGFGSGLNFINTALLWHTRQNKDQALNDQHLHYISIEKRPLSIENLRKIYRQWEQFSTISKPLLKHYPSTTFGKHQLQFTHHNLTLTLFFMPAEIALADLVKESESQQQKLIVDHWFLDGFAPAKNISMWETEIAEKIAQLSAAETRLSTYSVASVVKKPLMEVGFQITKRAGFGRKREMLTARFNPEIKQKEKSKFINIKYEAPWFYQSHSKTPERVAIVGSGIAGCAMAYSLHLQNIKSDLYECNSSIASAASGAAAGIFHPQLTRDMNYNSQFNWLAYLYLLRFLSDLGQTEKNKLILSQGVDRVLKSSVIKEELMTLVEDFNFGHWIKDASNLSQSTKIIQYPHAAAINMPAFCQLLLDRIPDNQKEIFLNQRINKINQEKDGQWVINSDKQKQRYKHLVFCGGANSNLIQSLFKSPTNVSRGQTCFFGHQQLAQKLSHTLCEKIYLVPRDNNQFHLGTTFESFIDDQLNSESQQSMLKNAAELLEKLSLPFLSSKEISNLELNGTMGYRLHSSDRLPIIGGAVDYHKLENDFSDLGQKRIKRDPLSYYNRAGLWLNTGYGSHGLLYSLLSSQHLTSMITNSISPIDNNLSNAIHPARFIIRHLRQLSRI